jgi:hypothetical protein
MRLSGTFAFVVWALSSSAGATEVNTMNYAARNALSMDTWYRVGMIKVRENAADKVTAALRTAPSAPKLVFNLRRH